MKYPTVEEIISRQRDRADKRVSELYSLLDKPTIKKINNIRKKMIFMFPMDEANHLGLEVKIFQSVSNNKLTLDQLGNVINSKGREFESMGLDIDKTLSVIIKIANDLHENDPGNWRSVAEVTIKAMQKNNAKNIRYTKKV